MTDGIFKHVSSPCLGAILLDVCPVEQAGVLESTLPAQQVWAGKISPRAKTTLLQKIREIAKVKHIPVERIWLYFWRLSLNFETVLRNRIRRVRIIRPDPDP